MNIQAVDTEWLLWVNGHHSPMTDNVMWQASQATTWLPLYVLLLVYLGYIYKGKETWKSWLPFISIVAAFGVAAGLADYISSGILKPLFERPRPSHNEAIASVLHIVNGYRGGAYGFPSSHAANTSAVVLLFALFFGYRSSLMSKNVCIAGRTLICFLALGYWLPNCYSRMYLGVHYPTDLVAGTLIGCLTAICAYLVWRRIFCKIKQKQLLEHP